MCWEAGRGGKEMARELMTREISMHVKSPCTHLEERLYSSGRVQGGKSPAARGEDDVDGELGAGRSPRWHGADEDVIGSDGVREDGPGEAKSLRRRRCLCR